MSGRRIRVWWWARTWCPDRRGVVGVAVDAVVPDSGAWATVVEVAAGGAVLVGAGATVVLGSVCFGTVVVVWRWVVVVTLTTETGTAVGGVVRTSR